MARTFSIIVISVFLSSAHPLFCQSPSSPDSALAAILSGLEGVPLSLQQAVDHALKNATSVRKAEAAYMAVSGTIRREAGLFDPSFFFNLNYQDLKQPTASFFSGASVLATQQTNVRTGVRMDFPIGTRLELSLNTVKLNTNSQFAFLNPEYDALGSLSLRQPLLGGFAASARKQLTKSERAGEAEKARYDLQVLGVRAAVEHMYWDLYVSERNYAVQKLTRDRADAFLSETELRAKAGLVGPNQVASARTFLAQQKLLFLEREEQLDRQSDQLASLIGVRPEPGRTRFITLDEPPRDYPVGFVDELVESARRNNLDLQAAQHDVEAAHALSSAAGWEAFPSINLIGSLGGTGLSGNAQNVIFNNDTLRTTRGGSYGDALTQVSKRDFPNWSIGVEVNIPIGFRSGLGEQDRLEAEELAAQQRYIERSRMLEDQVRAAYRELFHGKNRIEAAREGVEAAQEQIRIGMIEFHNGRLTAFELVRLGEDFAVAQQRYSEALVRTAKAAASLRQLTSGAYPAITNH